MESIVWCTGEPLEEVQAVKACHGDGGAAAVLSVPICFRPVCGEAFFVPMSIILEHDRL